MEGFSSSWKVIVRITGNNQLSPFPDFCCSDIFLVLSWEECVYYSLVSARIEHFCARGTRVTYFLGNIEFCSVWKKKEGSYSAILLSQKTRGTNSLSGWAYKQEFSNLVGIVEKHNSQLWNGSRAGSLEAGVCLVLGVLTHFLGEMK